MIRRVLAFIFLVAMVVPRLNAQNRFGLEVGEGWSYLKSGPESGINYNFSTDPEFSFGGYYLRRINQTMYLGVRVFFEQYAYTYKMEYTDTAGHRGGEIDDKISMIFLAPTFDIAVDRHQILHAFASGAYGMLHRGSQKDGVFDYRNSSGVLTGYETDNLISTSMLRFDLGLVEHVRLGELWHLTVTEEYGIPMGTQTLFNNPVNTQISVSPKYFAIRVGVMYKFVFTGWPARYDDGE
jgi:hypothetical protein